MTTSIFKINIPESFSLATRPNGAEARAALLRALDAYDVVELDFAQSSPTPSFADECLGITCKEIGWEAFKRRVKILNVTDTSRSLFKHVILRRRSEIMA